MTEVVVDGMPEGFWLDGGSLFGNDDEGRAMRLTSGSTVVVTAYARKSASDGWAVVALVTNRDNREVEVVIPFANLIGSGIAALKMLVDQGLVVCPGQEKNIVTFLQLCEPTLRLRRVEHLGWIDEEFVFALPDTVIGNTGGETIRLELESNTGAEISIRPQGTLLGWQNEIALRTAGNPLLVAALLSAFSGPLLRVVGLDGGGFHFYGKSSRGKTTCLLVATSVWGCGCDPAIDSARSFATRWNSTQNALEGVAASHSDTITPLDEMGVFDGSDIGSAVYTLAGGEGKKSLTSSRTIRQNRAWRGNLLSTGEKSLEAAIRESGKTMMAGQSLRLIDIQVDDILPTPPTGMSAADFAIDLKRSCGQQYGTAGRAYLQGLIAALEEDQSETVLVLRASLDEYTVTLTPEGARPEQARAIRRFALLRVAGEIAIDLGVLPLDGDEVGRAVTHLRDLWFAENRSVAGTDRAIQSLQEFLVRNHAVLPSIDNPNAKLGNVRGFWNKARNIFLFTSEQLVSAANTDNLRDLAEVLKGRNLLVTNEPGRLKYKARIASMGDQYLRLYAIRERILSLELDDRLQEIAQVLDEEPV